jgi:hypothetical protein
MTATIKRPTLLGRGLCVSGRVGFFGCFCDRAGVMGFWGGIGREERHLDGRKGDELVCAGCMNLWVCG